MLTRAIVEKAFDIIGQEAREAGVVCEIAVFGGTSIMLASDIRNATGDVDAVFRLEPQIIYDAAAKVARTLNLPHDWLNQAVKDRAPPIGGGEPNLLPFGEYPRDNDGAVGLRVLLPTPTYLLAMKLIANRAAEDIDKRQTDMSDTHSLMKITGLESYEQLLALLKQCYPHVPGLVEPNVHARIHINLKAALDDYDPDKLPATWNAGTGPATR